MNLNEEYFNSFSHKDFELLIEILETQGYVIDGKEEQGISYSSTQIEHMTQDMFNRLCQKFDISNELNVSVVGNFYQSEGAVYVLFDSKKYEYKEIKIILDSYVNSLSEIFVKTITTNIPYTKNEISINLNGKNLIITGSNGSGKTSLVNSIYKKLEDIIRFKKFDMLTQWNQNLNYYLKEKESSEEGSIKYNQAVQNISVYKNNIEDLNSFPNIEINNQKKFSALVDKEQALIEFFEAGRRSDILNVKSASAINYDQNELKNNSIDIGNKLEQHLVNLYTRRSFAISNKADDKLESSITKWLNKFISNLKFLMEDDSVDLEFNVDDFKLYIKQNEKEKYTFQNLSSGYSSIFNIFSRLLMRAEYLKVPPNKLSGIVIIDEIDAHLHVSLQKKILPFLSESFSRIQFIVTTHSPFVLTSISKSVIYDISSKEQVENLSSYSYEAILEGLFNVTSASKLLQDKIEIIANLLNTEPINIEDLEKSLKEIPNIGVLDDESRFFINKAKFEIQKSLNKDEF